VRRPRGLSLLEITVVVAIIAILLAIIVPRLRHSREQSALEACRSNLAHIAQKVMLYHQEYDTYPPALYPDSTYPNLGSKMYGSASSLPTCPAAGSVTYEYTRYSGYAFTVLCAGDNHGDLAADNYPQYQSETSEVVNQ
jgi:prepilin-type N-terminal cleavage/methylation domain-containing protein